MPSFDINLDIEFEIYCDTCNAGLCNNSTIGFTRNRNQRMVRVKACDNCINDAESRGYQRGLEEARGEQ